MKSLAAVYATKYSETTLIWKDIIEPILERNLIVVRSVGDVLLTNQHYIYIKELTLERNLTVVRSVGNVLLANQH